MRFFRTPKGLLLIILVMLVALAAPAGGASGTLPGLVAAVLVAALFDAVILRWRNGGWELPSGAMLTALIVGMVLSPFEPAYVVVATAVFGVASKYVFRSRGANIFNPAALALVVSFHVFNTAQSWWGALPELPSAALIILLGLGVFMTDRVNKIPMALTFLGLYYLSFTIMAFGGSPEHVAEIFRAPDLHASLYFAFFILTDPPTSPTTYRDQMIAGALIAAVAVGVFESSGAAYYMLAGVLAGNVWEMVRRVRRARRRPVPALVMAS